MYEKAIESLERTRGGLLTELERIDENLDYLREQELANTARRGEALASIDAIEGAIAALKEAK